MRGKKEDPPERNIFATMPWNGILAQWQFTELLPGTKKIVTRRHLAKECFGSFCFCAISEQRCIPAVVVFF